MWLISRIERSCKIESYPCKKITKQKILWTEQFTVVNKFTVHTWYRIEFNLSQSSWILKKTACLALAQARIYAVCPKFAKNTKFAKTKIRIWRPGGQWRGQKYLHILGGTVVQPGQQNSCTDGLMEQIRGTVVSCTDRLAEQIRGTVVQTG